MMTKNLNKSTNSHRLIFISLNTHIRPYLRKSQITIILTKMQIILKCSQIPIQNLFITKKKRQKKYPHKLIMWFLVILIIWIIQMIINEENNKTTQNKAHHHQKKNLLTLPKTASLLGKAQYKKITSEATVITWTLLWKEILILMGLLNKWMGIKRNKE